MPFCFAFGSRSALRVLVLRCRSGIMVKGVGGVVQDTVKLLTVTASRQFHPHSITCIPVDAAELQVFPLAPCSRVGNLHLLRKSSTDIASDPGTCLQVACQPAQLCCIISPCPATLCCPLQRQEEATFEGAGMFVLHFLLAKY